MVLALKLGVGWVDRPGLLGHVTLFTGQDLGPVVDFPALLAWIGQSGR
jgi:hypothetical protein